MYHHHNCQARMQCTTKSHSFCLSSSKSCVRSGQRKSVVRVSTAQDGGSPASHLVQLLLGRLLGGPLDAKALLGRWLGNDVH